MRYPLWGLIGCAALAAACKKDDGARFVPFDRLCPQRAEAICAARASCCDDTPKTCVADESARCKDARARFEDESDLVYDSELAAERLDEETAALDACEGPFALGRYFQGALAEGEDCERAAQCESDHCGDDTGVCEASSSDLCE